MLARLLLVSLLTLALLLTGCTSSGRTASPSQAAQTSPTAQLALASPTATRAPATPVAVPPTLTPVPPTPIPAPVTPTTARASKETQDYIVYMGVRFSLAGSALTTVGELSAQVGKEPRLLLDVKWRRDVSLATTTLRLAGKEMQTYERVPSEAKTLDSMITSTGKDLEYIAEEYAGGVAAMEPRRIERALERMQLMQNRFPALQAELLRLAGK